MREADAGNPVVTLSDDVVTLRPWSRDDAGFMAEAGADPAIQRYNGVLDRLGRPAPPLSVVGAESVIDEFASNWRAFATTETPSGVAFAIVDARSGDLVGCCGVDDWSKADVAQFGYWIAPEREAPRLRDSGGDPPHAVVVRARRGARLLDHRRGERSIGRSGPPSGVRVRGNDAVTRRLAGPALRRGVVRGAAARMEDAGPRRANVTPGANVPTEHVNAVPTCCRRARQTLPRAALVADVGHDHDRADGRPVPQDLRVHLAQPDATVRLRSAEQ